MLLFFPSEFPRYRFRSNHRLFDLLRLEFRETIKRENTIVVGGTDFHRQRETGSSSAWSV